MKNITDFVITSQRFVLVIDDLNQERVAHKFCRQFLRSPDAHDDQDDIKQLTIGALQGEENALKHFLEECAATGETSKWNVLLPTLSDFLCYKRPAEVFQFLHNLQNCPQVGRFFLWISVSCLKQPIFMVAACEYMADLILRLESRSELSIVSRKAGGGVSNKRYTYKIDKNQFTLEPMKHTDRSPSAAGGGDSIKSEHLGTFKIELEEEELVARNALKLPYEKTSEDGGEGNIIYTPDAGDDFDDEDPDEDLCI